jgi:hypothetical protein
MVTSDDDCNCARLATSNDNCARLATSNDNCAKLATSGDDCAKLATSSDDCAKLATSDNNFRYFSLPPLPLVPWAACPTDPGDTLAGVLLGSGSRMTNSGLRRQVPKGLGLSLCAVPS